jgi:heme-degrading monooxygenase HmoA
MTFNDHQNSRCSVERLSQIGVDVIQAQEGNPQMNEQAYTLAMYRVKEGHEDVFIHAWNELAETFSALQQPPIWGTLIRHRTDRTLFYSFGPWGSSEHVKAMRESSAARAAFEKLHGYCVEMTPGDYELVIHVDVGKRLDIL